MQGLHLQNSDMSSPSPQKYFLEFAPYQQVQLETKESAEGLVRIMFCVDPLDAYCVGCGQHSTFRSTIEWLPSIGSAMVHDPAPSVDALLNAKTALLPIDDDAMAVQKQDVLDYVRRPRYFPSSFICTRSGTHELRFYTRVGSDAFMKVGQYPALAELHFRDLSKYRKALGEQYAELVRGVGLFAHGIGIGAFVYLRRIFERLIATAHAKAAAGAGWDEAVYQRSRMDERILLLRANLPAVLVENRAVYSILSKGIHELSEDDCKAYFPATRAAIELILDEELAAGEREAKLMETRAAISSIAARVKGGA